MKRALFSSVLGAIMVSNNAYGALLFDGSTIRYQYLYPDSSSVYYDLGNITVGAGVELGAIVNGTYASLDISDTNILVDFYHPGPSWSPASFNGFRIWDVNGTLPAFTSVAVNGATNMVGFGPANITFDANNIYVNWQSLPFNPNTIVSLDVNGGPSVIPEPTAALLGSLSTLFLLRRRRHSA